MNGDRGPAHGLLRFLVRVLARINHIRRDFLQGDVWRVVEWAHSFSHVGEHLRQVVGLPLHAHVVVLWAHGVSVSATAVHLLVVGSGVFVHAMLACVLAVALSTRLIDERTGVCGFILDWTPRNEFFFVEVWLVSFSARSNHGVGVLSTCESGSFFRSRPQPFVDV